MITNEDIIVKNALKEKGFKGKKAYGPFYYPATVEETRDIRKTFEIEPDRSGLVLSDFHAAIAGDRNKIGFLPWRAINKNRDKLIIIEFYTKEKPKTFEMESGHRGKFSHILASWELGDDQNLKIMINSIFISNRIKGKLVGFSKL